MILNKFIINLFFKIVIIILIIISFYYYFSSVNLICLCVVGKEENAYVKEYVNHYKKLGYQKIFIYDNNDINGEKFEDKINEEIKSGFVSIINYRGYKGIQFEAYYNCYKNNYKKFKWLSFFDFDEFLELNPRNKTIQQFLNNKKFDNCQNIKVNWLIFTDNNLINYENKPIQERFTSSLNISKVIKSIVRGNLNINYWEKAQNVHSSYYGFKSCYASGKPILSNSCNTRTTEYAESEYAILKHYNTKSLDEYINKILKGRANSFAYGTDYIKSLLTHFFKINKKTKQKLEYIKNRLNISFQI